MKINDPLNAFCRDADVGREGSATGPLLGCTFAVKDVFDIAGSITGNGHPLWLETHPPAERTASAVERLLAAGARLVGKTYCDELTYSINGENVHYGTPLILKAPGRVPGGSSSGSAAAVSGGLVDLALGTDCGGSVRIPASYCGIYGIRTSHGLVPADGVVPLAPSFDTVGWFARSASMMRQVGSVLLPAGKPFVPRRLLIATDAFEAVNPTIAAALTPAIKAAAAVIAQTAHVRSTPSIRPNGVRSSPSAGRRDSRGARSLDRSLPTGIRTRHPRAVFLDSDHHGRRSGSGTAQARGSGAPRAKSPRGRRDVVSADGTGNRAQAQHAAGRARGVPRQRLRAIVYRGARPPPADSVFRSALSRTCPLGLSMIGPRGSDQGILDWAAAHLD